MSNKINKINVLDEDDVKQIEWTGSGLQFDLDLQQLGISRGLKKFFVVNPNLKNQDILRYIDEPPDTNQCIIWLHDGNWVAKLFTKDWTEKDGYYEIKLIKPTFVWSKNQHFDRLMTFKADPFGIYEPDIWDSQYKLVWYLDPRFNPTEDKVWAISCTPIGVKVKGTKEMGYLVPDVSIQWNPDLPNLGIDVNNYYPPYYDLQYECAWVLNKNLSEDETWVVKFKPNYRKSAGWKWLGVIEPNFTVEYNPDLGELNYDIDYVIPLSDLNLEHVWMLDEKYMQNGEQPIWAFKMYIPELQDVMGRKKTKTKYVGSVDPVFDIEINSELGDVEFNIDYVPPWYDLKYTHIWNLDKKHLDNPESEIWAIKAKCTVESQGEKLISEITPRLYYEYNEALPKLEYNINDSILHYDFIYEHVYYLDEKFSPTGEKIWALKINATKDPQGQKELGYITPTIKDQLDVIFISYYEPNAEENWERVLEKAPWAKRIDGVKGIFEAHKQAALISETDMFYVVDGDAWLVDDWQFDYQPNIFDRDCAYVWHSLNPVNGLSYGYGGLKLLSKSMMINAKAMTKLDMTTSVMPKLKVMEKISNETRFDVDEFSTWRSAFRECVKLAVNLAKDPESKDDKERLDQWLNSSLGNYSTFAQLGANYAVKFVNKYINKYDVLLKINDRVWIEKEFNKLNKNI